MSTTYNYSAYIASGDSTITRFSWDGVAADEPEIQQLASYPLDGYVLGATNLTADPCHTLVFGTTSLGNPILMDTAGSTEFGEDLYYAAQTNTSGSTVVSLGDGFFYRPIDDSSRSSFAVNYLGDVAMTSLGVSGFPSLVTTASKPYQKVGRDPTSGRVAILGGTTTTSFLSVVTLKTPAVLSVDDTAKTITLSDTTGVVDGASIILGIPDAREDLSRTVTVQSVDENVVTLSGSPTLSDKTVRALTGWPEASSVLLDEAVSDISWPEGYTPNIGKSYSLAVAGDYVYNVLEEDASDAFSIARVNITTGDTENVVTGLTKRAGWSLPPLATIPSVDGESVALLYADTGSPYNLMMVENAGGVTPGTPISLGQPRESGTFAYNIATAPIPSSCVPTPAPTQAPCDDVTCSPAPDPHYCPSEASSSSVVIPLTILLVLLAVGLSVSIAILVKNK